MSAERERLARLRRRLWQPPRPHGQQPMKRTVSPVELFYDLVVAAGVGEAADRLSSQPTGRGLAGFAAVFTLIWIAWLNGSLYYELHGRDDVQGRTIVLVQVLALVPLGAYASAADAGRGAAFAAVAAILFVVLAVVWWRAGRDDAADFRQASRLYVGGTLACAVVLAGTIALPPTGRVIAWLALDAAYLAGLAYVVVFALPAATLTITGAVIDRFGQFIIIVLGETVTGVVVGLAHDTLSVAVALASVTVGFGAWWTYFDFAGNRSPRQTRAATVTWILAHLPVTAAIAVMGAAMLVLVEHPHAGSGPASAGWLLGAGAAVALAATMTLAASLQAWRDDRARYRPLAATSAVVAPLCLVPAAAGLAPLPLAVVLIVLLAIPWCVAVARGGGQETEDGPGADAA